VNPEVHRRSIRTSCSRTEPLISTLTARRIRLLFSTPEARSLRSIRSGAVGSMGGRRFRSTLATAATCLSMASARFVKLHQLTGDVPRRRAKRTAAFPLHGRGNIPASKGRS
jgi:hypothetical protein